MPLLERAIKEAERLRPPLVMLMRMVLEDMEYAGRTLPKGSLAMVSPAASHRIPEVFKNPHAFDPDRYAPGREEDRKALYSLIGFGGGKHRCMGMVFAYQQVKAIWSVLLRRFELELCEPDYRPNYTTFVVGPHQPCRVRYRRRTAGPDLRSGIMNEKLLTLGKRPPTFEEAKNRRQKVRAAGMSPDYWYPAEWSSSLARGQVREVKFWGRSIALFRGDDGLARAVEDRCAHRQLKLSKGEVTGCRLTCTYHGWQYDGEGRCVDIPHDLFGNKTPQIQVGHYPVKERYGILWIFPGDPALAEVRKIPEIPELTGDAPWGTIPIDFTLAAHHSMIIDNVSDFSHAYLHRRSRPFTDAKLTKLETVGDEVRLSYQTKVGTGKISGLFVDRRKTNTNAMDLAYAYPYQWSNTDGKIKHWLFVLPIDERTTRAFFVFYFSPDTLKVPFLPITIPRQVIRTVLRIAKEVLVRPLLSEDKFAVEAEQEGYETHFDKPIAELNPAVREFQDLTIRKWEEHLARTQTRPATPRNAASSPADQPA